MVVFLWFNYQLIKPIKNNYFSNQPYNLKLHTIYNYCPKLYYLRKYNSTYSYCDGLCDKSMSKSLCKY